jgi:hypothetical protein
MRTIEVSLRCLRLPLLSPGFGVSTHCSSRSSILRESCKILSTYQVYSFAPNTVLALNHDFMQIPNTLSRPIPTTTNASQGSTNMVAMVHLGTGHLGQMKNLASYSYARTPPRRQLKYSTNLPPDVVVKSQRTIQGNSRMAFPQRRHQETIRKTMVSVPQSCSVSIGFSGTRLWMQLTWPSSIKSKV